MFTLPESVTTFTVAEVHQQLLDYVNERAATGENDIEIDASQVSDVDAAGIQLLLSVSKSADERGLGFNLSDQSEIVTQMLKLSGAGRILGKEEV